MKVLLGPDVGEQDNEADVQPVVCWSVGGWVGEGRVAVGGRVALRSKRAIGLDMPDRAIWRGRTEKHQPTESMIILQAAIEDEDGELRIGEEDTAKLLSPRRRGRVLVESFARRNSKGPHIELSLSVFVRRVARCLVAVGSFEYPFEGE